MKTLATNSDNDIFATARGLAIAEGVACQKVIADCLVNTQKGELQNEADTGIDYFGTVFVNSTFIKLWALEVEHAIRNIDWVKDIKEFEYNFDPSTNTLSWHMIAINDEDEEVPLGSSREMKNGSVISYDMDWDNIPGKPENLSLALDTINRMRDASGNRSYLKPKDSVTTVKDTINETVIEPLSKQS